MPIFRRTNCIITASGIVTLYKRLYSMPVESGLNFPNSVPQNIVRGSARNRGEKIYKFLKTAKNSKYPLKYRRTFLSGNWQCWCNHRAPSSAYLFSGL